MKQFEDTTNIMKEESKKKKYIPGGYTVWARKIKDSAIFCQKPDKWFKIWFYIVNTVSHSNEKGIRGQKYFTYEGIHLATQSSSSTIKHCIEYLKKGRQIATQKKQRGFIIVVNKYDLYQDSSNYKKPHRKEDKRKTEVLTEGTQVDALYNNNDNNDKKVKNDKKNKRLYVPNPKHLELAALLSKNILTNNPDSKGITPRQLNLWSEDVDKMIRLDNRTYEQIESMINFSQKHSFWHKNILSMDKLRKQFDRLTLELRGDINSEAEEEDRSPFYKDLTEEAGKRGKGEF